LTSITIPSSIESIGNSAFLNCSGLTKINITDLAKWCKISFANTSSNPLAYAQSKSLYLNDVEITNLVIEIAELTGAMTVSEQLSKNPKLRRENRVKSIHSSLAIEQNSLSIDQVSDVIDGKRVLGPPQDIREVKNAYEAYEIMTKLDPYSVKDLLKAHMIMMAGLVKEAGMFRSKGVGVYAGDQLIHAGTPANYVPDLIGQLFDWLKKSKLHPLVKSCIFHYEFEFIHPFADGNGRTGRLWHTLLLAKWKEFFLWLPIESVIRERQDGYYKALNASNTAG
jgi:Fic family protein